jgi:hypothetical protein
MEYKDRSNEYLAKRSIDDRDLLSEVINLLSSSALHDTATSLHLYFQDNDLLDKKDNVQRFYMNKFFNLLLLAIPANTIDQRYCLITDGTVDDWLNLFKKKTLPFLREHLNA